MKCRLCGKSKEQVAGFHLCPHCDLPCRQHECRLCKQIDLTGGNP